MKKSHIIAILVIAIAIGAIITTMADSSTYATFSLAANHPSKTYHVVGKLNKSMPQEYNPKTDADVFSFFLVDNEGTEKKVVLNKARPQDFEKSEQVVVIGKMNDDKFVASDILMKCPSKYNNPKDDLKTVSSNH
jgi:cytochrome c-type biogenesis protein CcmE